jgi:hypothetical protein
LVAKDSDRLAAARADLKQAFKSCPLNNAYPGTEISTLQSTPEKFGASVGVKNLPDFARRWSIFAAKSSRLNWTCRCLTCQWLLQSRISGG